MGRAPCCEKDSVKRGPWTPEEDAKLLACVAQHGTGSWRTLPKKAGLQRCGKSCRLRWTNYLRPDLKHGRFTDHEEQTIVKLHAALGSRWSLIAAQLPGRTDNDVKNYWNTRLKKKLCEMGIDPITHKPISQLLADLAGSMSAMTPAGQQSGGGGVDLGGGSCRTIADAALGCFKDDMLNVIMRRNPSMMTSSSSYPLPMPTCTTSSMISSLQQPPAPGASSSTSSPTPETAFDRTPQLQPFIKFPPFLQASSKPTNQMHPHSLSQARTAMGEYNEGIKQHAAAISTPSSLLPPYLRFLNPPSTPSPHALNVSATSPFHPFLRGAPSFHARPPCNSFSHLQEDLPNAKSMVDMNTSPSNSTLISGMVPKRSMLINEEANSLNASAHMEHSYSITNQYSLSRDADKFLTSQADLQTQIADPHPWFSNLQEEQQHIDKEGQTHEISMFHWANEEEGDHSSSNVYAKSKGDSTLVANLSPTCTSRSSSTCSNFHGPLDLGIRPHTSSHNIIEQQAPLTSVDAILWDLSDLTAFMS